jgi:CBS domain-containing protein
MAKSVRDAMTSNPRTVTPDRPVVEVARIMRDEDVGSVPIIEDDGRLAGTVTDRDITIRLVAEGRDPQSVRVSDIASRDIITVDPQQDLDEALRLMARHQIRRLPVVEEDGRLVGIVAQADVAAEAKGKRVGETVEEISK